MQKRRSTGLTLIELLVVVIIIGILASIAYPSYRRYAVRATRNEAKVALLQATQALEKCYTRMHSYADCIAAGADDGGVDVVDTESYDLAVADDPEISDTTYSLQAVATGGQASDDVRCGTLRVDQAGRRTVEGGGDERECW
jgi:type IV pilus assembly protein PilE